MYPAIMVAQHVKYSVACREDPEDRFNPIQTLFLVDQIARNQYQVSLKLVSHPGNPFEVASINLPRKMKIREMANLEPL